MTGAYAHDWSGPRAWAGTEDRGRGSRGGGRHGRHGHPGRHDHDSRGSRGSRGEFGGLPLAALAGWAMARSQDGPDDGPGRGPGRHGRGPGRHGHGPSPEEMEKLEAMMAMRRMRGRGPGPFGRGGGPRGRGRRGRGDVRLAVLRLLAEEPSNGYQLMQTIEQRSQGQWRPSPGSMYPTLSQLEDEQLIRSTEAEGGRRFEITDAGRTALEERSGEPDPWASEPEADEHAMRELGPLVLGIGQAVWQVAGVANEAQRAKAAELLAETRRRLYGILAEDPDAGDDVSAPTGDRDARAD